jgi:hypothetical protein
MRKSFLLVSTHLAAGVAGWLACRGPAGDSPPAGQDPERHGKAADRRAEREDGRRLLEGMRQAWNTKNEAAQAASAAAENPKDSWARGARESRATMAKELEEIRRKVEAYVLPADPGAELDRLIKSGDHLDLIPLVIAWLQKDPEAALHHLESTEELLRSGNLYNALDLWVEHAGAAEVIRLSESSPKWQGRMTQVALKTAVAADPTVLGELMERLEGRLDRATILRSAFSEVPENQRTAALDWIMANLKGREMVGAIKDASYQMDSTMGDPAGAKAFLKAAVARGLGPDAMEELNGWGNYKDIMSYGVGSGSSMDERIEVALKGYVQGNTEEERRAFAQASIVAKDVADWFNGGVWNEALRTEGVTTAELWSQCLANFPEFQDADRDIMLKAFFTQAAIHDPEAALAMLKAEGKEADAGAFSLSALDSAHYSDLEAGLQLVGRLPDDAIRGQLPRYDRYYSSSTTRLTQEYGSYWIDWLTRQPAGLNHDLLLHHTATALSKQGNQRGAAELRAMIQDADIGNRSTPAQ